MKAARPITSIKDTTALKKLAIRINAEHKVAQERLNSGLKHAIAAGQLLLEAKKQLTHGEWLPWLEKHCEVRERTAQAYMRVARGFASMDSDKSATVADLSFRDALNMLSVTGSAAASMPPESFDRVSKLAGDVGLRHALSNVRRADMLSKYTLETPRALLPSPTGRKMRVARNPTKRQWMLAVGPDVSREKLMQREQLAREDESVRALQQEQDELKARADELEAEAKRLRADAEAVGREINAAIKEIVGPVSPFTETFDFQCDETIDAELAALPQEQRVDRLLAARGSPDGELVEIERGYWGDMNLKSHQSIEPGPGEWTRIGSPEWLDEMFPDWNAEVAQ